MVNTGTNAERIEVVIFEGWCVGFRPISNDDLRIKWQQAKKAAEAPDGHYLGQLGKLEFGCIQFVNDALKAYDELTR